MDNIDFVFPKTKSSLSVVGANQPRTFLGVSNLETGRGLLLIRIPIMLVLTTWVSMKKLVFGKRLKTNTFWFDGASAICRQVKEGAFSWRALEIIYNLPAYRQAKNLNEKLAFFWNGLLNAKAVRNRLKIAKQLLAASFREKLDNLDSLEVLSVASGSARAVFETIAELSAEGYRGKIRVTLIDLDPSAIDYARNLAQELDIEKAVVFINDSTTNLEKLFRSGSFDVIEMIGFLEYRPHHKAVDLVDRLRHLLKKNGTLITSQVRPNIEQLFLLVVINWPMVYRTDEQFKEILISSGFQPNNISINTEPQQIHSIAQCIK